MRIITIIPGSGGTFYCQNCQRDLALVHALRELGHDVLTVPLYLPLGAVQDAGPSFYGAVSLYLRHRFPRLDWMLPAGIWRALDAQPVLRLAARLSGSTQAGGLADLTLSMLRGEEGRQAAELDRLASWLHDVPGERPDVVLLSNALLLGLARRLKAATGAPVICWLQDEHVWADAMPAHEAARIWQELRARAADADGFAAVSRFYAEEMRARLALPAERIRTIYPGVVPAANRPAHPGRQPRTIGFLSRLAADEGFGLCVEAFIALHREARFADVQLRATGGLPGDRAFLRRQRASLRAAGLGMLAHIEPQAFVAERAAFLASLSLLSVPAPAGDAFGLYLLEAMAAGVPVVEPPVGSYPEILAEAGCGLLSRSTRPEDLAAAWALMLDDPARQAAEAQAGRAAVARAFNLERMAREVVAFCACLSSKECCQPGQKSAK